MSTSVEFAVPTEAARVVPADLSSARDLHRRLNAALEDLGLSGVLPPRWATPARSGFFFAPHNLNQAANLVDALERIERALSEAGIDVRSTESADCSDTAPTGHPVTS